MSRISPAVAPRDGEPVIWKTYANAFLETGLAERIRETGRTEVIIAGDMTHVCVSATARAAAEAHGFRVTVVADATATRDLPNPLGGVIPAQTVWQSALAELHDAFGGSGQGCRRLGLTTEMAVIRLYPWRQPNRLSPPGAIGSYRQSGDR